MHHVTIKKCKEHFTANDLPINKTNIAAPDAIKSVLKFATNTFRKHCQTLRKVKFVPRIGLEFRSWKHNIYGTR